MQTLEKLLFKNALICPLVLAVLSGLSVGPFARRHGHYRPRTIRQYLRDGQIRMHQLLGWLEDEMI